MQTVDHFLYDRKEFEGKNWYEMTVKGQAEEQVSKHGLLGSSLETLQGYFHPSMTFTKEEAEYEFTPKYEEYRKKVTHQELDRDLDILKGNSTEKLVKGAGCLFYHISEDGKLWLLLEKKLSENKSSFKRESKVILSDLGGRFEKSIDSCAFSCAKREVEEESNGILSMDGTEELYEDSVKTPYFLYLKEIDKISTLNFGRKENKTGISRNISWYHLTPQVQKLISQRIPSSLFLYLCQKI